MTPLLYSSPEECCACRACSSVCPKGAVSFAEDKYGFSFPRVDQSLCVECGQCLEVCNFHSDAFDFKRLPVKGFAASLKDKGIIAGSTSGGVFMAVAAWVIKKGGCVFGCVWDEDMNAVHACAETFEQLLPMQGSKYVQSNVGNSYREVREKLRQDRYVLFSGTPCQVAALKSFLKGKEYEKLITLDLICHGVPNNRFFHQYLSLLGKKYGGKVTDYHFRHKNPDWKHGCVWMEIDRGGKRIQKKLLYVESPYSYLFSKKNKCSRLSCSNCKYACQGRVGDMTIGDFWGYRKVKIGFDYRDGLSCVLVNNPGVLPILAEMDLILQEVPVDSIINGNTHLRCPSTKDESWESVMETAAKDGFEVIAKDYFKNNKRQILKKKIEVFLPKGLVSRVKQIKNRIYG